MDSTVEERLTGTADYVTIDMSYLLGEGEEITGTPTLTPSNEHVSFVPGTAAVSPDGTEISACFLHASAGTTRVDISCSTNLSSVVKKSYFTFVTFDPPPAVS